MSRGLNAASVYLMNDITTAAPLAIAMRIDLTRDTTGSSHTTEKATTTGPTAHGLRDDRDGRRCGKTRTDNHRMTDNDHILNLTRYFSYSLLNRPKIVTQSLLRTSPTARIKLIRSSKRTGKMVGKGSPDGTNLTIKDITMNEFEIILYNELFRGDGVRVFLPLYF